MGRRTAWRPVAESVRFAARRVQVVLTAGPAVEAEWSSLVSRVRGTRDAFWLVYW